MSDADRSCPLPYIPRSESPERTLITALLYQAIKDHLYYGSQHTAGDKGTARSFLFNDNHILDWGDTEITPRDLLLEIDVDLSWVRAKVKAREKVIDPDTRHTAGRSLL